MATGFISDGERPAQLCCFCGAPFYPKQKHLRCCSLACAKKQSNLTRTANAKARLARVCLHCSQPFTMRRIGKAYEGKYCSYACSAQAFGDSVRIYSNKAERKRAEKDRAKARRPVLKRACKVCGLSFEPLPHLRLICSDACRERKAAPPRPNIEIQCRECEATFTTPLIARPRVFCNSACARKAHRRIGKQVDRARRRRVPYELVDPIKVFIRDGWKCQLCGIETPRALRGTSHPTAPELDHIHPLSKGGFHSHINTQCACRGCNGYKGSKILKTFSLFQ